MKQKLSVYMFSPIVLCLALALTGCPNLMQPASSPTAATGGITGRALYYDQSDNSGIIISAEPTDGVKSLAVQRMLAGAEKEAKTIAAQTTTDAKGAYTLTGLVPRTYVVTASSRDTLERAVTTSVKVCAGQTVEVIVLCLTLTGQISGKATLSDANTLPNGSLGIVVFIAGTSYSAMTAADGSYTISGVPAGKNYTLVASKVGYDSSITNVNVTVLRTTTVASFNLMKSVTPTATGSVSGTAQLNDGPPNAGVFVYLAGTSCIAVTDDAGTFSLTGVAPGIYSLVASKEGYTSASSSVSVTAGSSFNVGTLSLTAIPREVSAPQFSPSTGTFNTDQLVTISDATPGATIYYTAATGGTAPADPTTSSAVYSAPIPVAGDGTVTTIKAMAAKAGMSTSAVAQSTYTINYVVLSPGMLSSPQFSPGAGSYTDPLTVTISTSPPGASVRYTTDGSTPTSTFGTLYLGEPISVAVSKTLKAIAYEPGWIDSPVSSAHYSFPVAAPTFSPAAGSFTSAQSVTISTATAGASIRYTTDGSDPNTSGTSGLAPVTVSVDVTETIRAIAYEPGWTDSPVSTAIYILQVAAPTFSPAAGNFTSAQSVIISTTTAGAYISYTTDGSTPKSSGGTPGIAIVPVSASETINAIAYKPGWTDSPVASATYTIGEAIPIYLNDVEGYLGGMTATGFWHITELSSPWNIFHSPQHSWWYGQESNGTYDNGSINSGDLFTPAIIIPSDAPSPRLSFWYWYETEGSSTYYERRSVYISTFNGSVWTTWTLLAQLSGDVMHQWNQWSVDLSAFKGQTIRIRFNFNTIDAILNHYRGWYIDDIQVTQ